MVQNHLSYEDMTNLGCFYTPEIFVDDLLEMIKTNVPNYKDFTFADTSCGYGAFLAKLNDCETIGCDIDEKAIATAKKISPKTKYLNINTLVSCDREQMGLTQNTPLFIIGNPPYNDTTSKVKQEIKQESPCEIDASIKTRDLGMSFMLSYNCLKADYVAVLHPLSYLIKYTNYKTLKPFLSNYALIDHKIVNSQQFGMTSKSTGFPILLALYQRRLGGTTYKDVLSKQWKTCDGKVFNVNVNSIKNYIEKYPSKYVKPNCDDVLFFTMRDINALKRSKTFIREYSPNAIVIDKKKFSLYCYVDIFKDYIQHIPYYLGNCDVFIDYNSFEKIEDAFVCCSLEKHPYLKNYVLPKDSGNNAIESIDNYFVNLLGENYVY